MRSELEEKETEGRMGRMGRNDGDCEVGNKLKGEEEEGEKDRE